MPRTRPAHPVECRAQIVALHRTGRRIGELAREVEPCGHTIRGRIRQAERAPARDDPLSEAEREELRRLRRGNRQLRMERDILSKAAARVSRGTRGGVAEVFEFMTARPGP